MFGQDVWLSKLGLSLVSFVNQRLGALVPVDSPPPPPIKIGACLVPPLTVLFFCRLIMCYLKIFPVLFRAVLLGKFQDLVGAQPYQTQLGQHSALNIIELCSYI